MRVVACFVAVAWVACSYSDPNLAQTQFLCAGGGACPSGQVCKSGICVASSHDGLACGTNPCPAGEQCCDDNINPRRCIGGTQECLGITAFCDGVEDCVGGTRCCQGGTTQTCTEEDSCSQVICQEPADCPSTAQNCCVDPGGAKPWKVCSLFPC